jgi:hypothetical protein
MDLLRNSQMSKLRLRIPKRRLRKQKVTRLKRVPLKLNKTLTWYLIQKLLLMRLLRAKLMNKIIFLTILINQLNNKRQIRQIKKLQKMILQTLKMNRSQILLLKKNPNQMIPPPPQ